MIKESIPLSMPEAIEYLKHSGDGGKEMKSFIRKFNSLKSEKAKELREKLRALDLVKIDEGGISKIIDVLPQTPEEVNKALVGAGLDEDEIKKIIDTVKEFI